jgi:hypothetical protein
MIGCLNEIDRKHFRIETLDNNSNNDISTTNKVMNFKIERIDEKISIHCNDNESLSFDFKQVFPDKHSENDSTTFGFVVDNHPDKIPARIGETMLYVGSQDAARNVEFLIENSVLNVLNVGYDPIAIDSNIINIKHIPLLDESSTNLLLM